MVASVPEVSARSGLDAAALSRASWSSFGIGIVRILGFHRLGAGLGDVVPAVFRLHVLEPAHFVDRQPALGAWAAEGLGEVLGLVFRVAGHQPVDVVLREISYGAEQLAVQLVLDPPQVRPERVGHEADAHLLDAGAPARRLAGLADHVRWHAECAGDVDHLPLPGFQQLLVDGGHREFLDVQAFGQDQWNAAIALHAAVLGDPGGAEVLLLIQRHLRRRLDGHFRLAAFAEELAGVIVALNRNADAVPRTPLNHGHRTDAVEP